MTRPSLNRQVEPLLPLDAVQRQVVVVARPGQVRAASPASSGSGAGPRSRRPGTARRCRAASPSSSGLVRLKVWSWCSSTTGTRYFSNSGHPVLAVPARRSPACRLAALTGAAGLRNDGYAGTWFTTITCGWSPAGLERLLQPVGLLAADRGDVPGVEQHQAQVVAEVERRVARSPGTGRRTAAKKNGAFVARLAVAAVHLVVADARRPSGSAGRRGRPCACCSSAGTPGSSRPTCRCRSPGRRR